MNDNPATRIAVTSQTTAREAGVMQVLKPQLMATYTTLQEQIDEDADGIRKNDDRIREARNLIADLKKDSAMRRERRNRNIQRKRIVAKDQMRLMLVDEQ